MSDLTINVRSDIFSEINPIKTMYFIVLFLVVTLVLILTELLHLVCTVGFGLQPLLPAVSSG
ncbi:hypothetical protein B0I26_11070 [Anoxybacillus vitaminiphilus]|uniref:Uncharacterized protein n=1 Tax=Paranoxybacillus vitaminiphilus TaxID=581036 RepID=A0A327YBE0_9BACL|nr:hypothetical protein B0I26_11070 [Anoxybacillus vitaminiphilus]